MKTPRNTHHQGRTQAIKPAHGLLKAAEFRRNIANDFGLGGTRTRNQRLKRALLYH